MIITRPAPASATIQHPKLKLLDGVINPLLPPTSATNVDRLRPTSTFTEAKRELSEIDKLMDAMPRILVYKVEYKDVKIEDI